EQGLAWLDDGEAHRLVGDVEAAALLARHREGRGGEIALAGKVLAIVGAAAVLALERRNRDHLGDLHQAAQVEPIVPREVEGAITIRQADAEQIALDRLDLPQAALQTRSVAKNADVVPHRVHQLLAQRIDVASPAL